jgi:hypothetical protein
MTPAGPISLNQAIGRTAEKLALTQWLRFNWR